MSKSVVDKKQAFLKAFIACADLTRAAAAAKIDRSCHYDWMRSDPEYTKAFAAARAEAAQTIEDSAVEWALEGIEEPIVYQGQFQFRQKEVRYAVLPDGRKVRERDLPKSEHALAALDIQGYTTVSENYGRPITIRRRSEGLHARLLKAFIPERYGDKVSTEISGPNGGPIPVTDERLKNLSDEQLLTLIEIARQLTGNSGDGGGTPQAPAQ